MVKEAGPRIYPVAVILPTETSGVPDKPVAVILSALISDCVWSAVAAVSIFT